MKLSGDSLVKLITYQGNSIPPAPPFLFVHKIGFKVLILFDSDIEIEMSQVLKLYVITREIRIKVYKIADKLNSV